MADKPRLENNFAAVDKEGFLVNHKEWSEQIAERIALNEGITLTREHWEVIYLLRHFYQEFGLSPAMRPLMNYIKLKTGNHKVNSVYLLTLFPGSPAKLGSKIAGLPKPDNCL